MYASGTLSILWKLAGTEGQPAVLCWHEGASMLPPKTWAAPGGSTLFGIIFDRLHDHPHATAPAASLQLRSRKLLSSLV